MGSGRSGHKHCGRGREWNTQVLGAGGPGQKFSWSGRVRVLDNSPVQGSRLKLESVHQESPRSEVFRKRATKPFLKQKQHKYLTWAKEKKNWTVAQWSKFFFSDKSKFSISFGNQGPESGGRLERHRVPDLNPIWNLWGIVKRNIKPNNTDELKATIKATWASIMPQQCHRQLASMPRCIEAVFFAKGAPTKY